MKFSNWLTPPGLGLGRFRGISSRPHHDGPPNLVFQGVAGAVRPHQLKCCGIVGAGLMGGGIAMACAEAGMKAWRVPPTGER